MSTTVPNLTYIITAVLAALLLGVTARYKLTREKQVMATLARVGVPDRMVPILALLQLIAAIGLLIGIVLRPLGVAAALGTLLFFLGAVAAHLRVKDVKGAPVPVALSAFSLLPLVAGIASV